MVNRRNIRPAFRSERFTKEQLEQRNLAIGHKIPTHHTRRLTNEELSESRDWTTRRDTRNRANIPMAPTLHTQRIVPTDSSLPQPQHLTGTASPYTLIQVGHRSDSRAQFAPHTNTYDADPRPRSNRRRAPTIVTQCTADLAELSEEDKTLREWKRWMASNKDPAKEAIDDWRTVELRLVSSCSDLRARFKLDGELAVNKVRDRTCEPSSHNFGHGFDRDGFYGRVDNLLRPRTMTVTNSKTGEKKVVRLDHHMRPVLRTEEEKESSETDSDDLWSQIARDRK